MRYRINGRIYETEADPCMRLVDLLRNVFGLTGTKEGCGEGECGACTVLVNGRTVNSCLVLAGQVQDTDIVTIEGLSEDGKPDRIQQAFINCGAIQCGFCTPGMILSTKALLDNNPCPDDEQIKTALSGNLCRCTGYTKIVAAVRMAAGGLQEAKA